MIQEVPDASPRNQKYYKSSDELRRRLEVLITSKKAGSKSFALYKEIVEILDRLLVDVIISRKEYKKIHDDFI